MSEILYLLFNQIPEQVRRVGARGGRATARNRRARLGDAVPPPAPVPQPPIETARQAIAALDAQFPWLRGAEKRLSSSRPENSNKA